jgi:prepilin-type N-terminal cleavage/methylation domain-containing protein
LHRGFTLAEALIGMVIILIVVMNMIVALPATLGYAADASIQIQAVGAAQDYLDVVRQYIKTNGVDTGLPAPPVIPIDAGNGFFSNGPQPSLGDFDPTAACSARSLFSFDCTVTVSWSAAGAERSVHVESYIASQAGF